MIVHVNAAGSSALLKILLFYVQMAGLQAPSGVFAGPLAAFFGFRVAAATGAFGGVCIAPLDHYGTQSVRLALPLLMLALLVVVLLVARCCARASQSDLLSLRRLARTALAIVLMTFSVCVAASFDVMRCRQVGDELVLEADARVTCAAAAATAWRHAATYGLLPIAGLVVAAIPSALLWLRRAHGGRLPDTHPVFGVLYECYRTERARLWWEAFVLARRAAVGLVVVFAENPLRRALFTSINAVGLLATAHVRPFASETENALDATAALFLAVLGATSGIDATALGWTGSVVVSSITAIPVVLIAAFLLRQTWRKFMLKRMKR
jgi:hypothetical protein